MLCENVLFLRLLNYFNVAINVLRFLVPLFLMIKLTLDIYKGIINPNDNDAKEKIAKRIFTSVIIFLIPTIVNIFLGLMEGITGTTFNYSECNSNIKNISYLEEQKELEKQLLETKNNQELLRKYEDYQKELEKLRNQSRSQSGGSSDGSSGTGGSQSTTDGSTRTIGKKYKLSASELKGLCGVAKAEQGSIDGAKAEATLMANRYELLKSSSKYYGKGLYNYVRNSGWFAHAAKHMSQGCPSDYLQAVRDVLVNGNRTMPLYVDEHDCFNCNSKKCSNGNKGDICKLEVNGKTISSMSKIKTRSNDYYIKNVTKVYTIYKQSSSVKYWTFYAFAKKADGSNRGDPFGYTKSAKDKIDSLNK
ncbi:MAG: hypothetical protein IKN63_03605 [Bacilli bacterium]|nr:hypothetical protein [Bacilli bacterium]